MSEQDSDTYFIAYFSISSPPPPPHVLGIGPLVFPTKLSFRMCLFRSLMCVAIHKKRSQKTKHLMDM